MVQHRWIWRSRYLGRFDGIQQVVGVLCTVDLLKRDTELKILFDCTDLEIQLIHEFVNDNGMRAIYLKLKR